MNFGGERPSRGIASADTQIMFPTVKKITRGKTANDILNIGQKNAGSISLAPGINACLNQTLRLNTSLCSALKKGDVTRIRKILWMSDA